MVKQLAGYSMEMTCVNTLCPRKYQDGNSEYERLVLHENPS